MPVKTLITAEEFLDLAGDGIRELIRGEIVEMSPPSARHGWICGRIAVIISRWADPIRAGFFLGNDSGIVTERDPDTVRGPDCQFISRKRLPEGLPKDGYLSVPPELAVEVLSPSNRWAEMMKKIDEYLATGVLEVWIVDPEDESIEVFRNDRGPVRFGRDSQLTSDVLPGFNCRVTEFFS
ncbi:MAG: Uma2 family endonuclease [Planctomycetaceae bacterium]|nr:Uma2 family endonuclease [Planctomycetaceae bacterium]